MAAVRGDDDAPVHASARLEDVGERQARQRGVASGAATVEAQPVWLGSTSPGASWCRTRACEQ
jgi:hypothetical protein